MKPSKAKRSSVKNRKRKPKEGNFWLWVVPLSSFLMKIIISLQISGFDWFRAGAGDVSRGISILLDKNYQPSYAWYGADGENYLKALLGLINDGLFSNVSQLSYWPAGYPIILWPLIILFGANFFFILSFLQSLLFALASGFFVSQIYQTRLRNYSSWIAFAIAFNPTLSLSSLAIGYEIPVVSCLLLSSGLLLRYFRVDSKNLFSKEIYLSALSLSVATFMQPRLLLIAFIFLGFWAVAKFNIRKSLVILFVTFLIVMSAPISLVIRNSVAINLKTISTNLGNTMMIGAGPTATGGYISEYERINCPSANSATDEASADSAKVKCVLSWYAKNPGKAAKLFWNKARFFWSPWFGPEANGTMARNPWLKVHPFKSTASTPDGFAIIYGTFGKIVSSLWVFLSILFLCRGFLILYRAGGIERLFSLVSFSSILINMITSMLTIGDHRFRIPTMAFSLTLQVVGLISLLRGSEGRLSGESPEVPWPSLKQKS